MNTKSNNPSRAKCEEIIRRILMTEVLEHGDNQHFRCAADFMNYFESLYPASPGLTKQVQRAVKSMDMPKNEKGFFADCIEAFFVAVSKYARAARP